MGEVAHKASSSAGTVTPPPSVLSVSVAAGRGAAPSGATPPAASSTLRFPDHHFRSRLRCFSASAAESEHTPRYFIARSVACTPALRYHSHRWEPPRDRDGAPTNGLECSRAERGQQRRVRSHVWHPAAASATLVSLGGGSTLAPPPSGRPTTEERICSSAEAVISSRCRPSTAAPLMTPR